MAKPALIFLGNVFLLLVLPLASAEVVRHTFLVHDLTVRRICKDQLIIAVNGQFPGPTIYAREGDTVIVHVINSSPYNLSIHWHGILQLQNNWQDGPEYITQCPIQPGNNYTYRFNIIGQEGTLWWHAHSGFLRATIHGALIILPRPGRLYPFPKPDQEVPIIIGEWYNSNVVQLEQELLVTGIGPNYSTGYTINGWPGDIYSCPSSTDRRILDEPLPRKFSSLKLPSSTPSGPESDIFKLKVSQGKTYLLRIINAALHDHMFFKIADHEMTVVAVDASYTDPYPTDVVVISAGQTVDVLLTADQPPASYYIASRNYNSGKSPRYYLLNPEATDKSTTAILFYDGAETSPPIWPILPQVNDTATAFKFLSSLTGLVTSPFWTPVPSQVDEHMFITVGLSLLRCAYKDQSLCKGPLNQLISASANNISFELPTQMSILQAYYDKVEGIYSDDFPNQPPVKFNFTNEDQRLDERLVWTDKGTRVKKVKYNATVEIVFQSTALVAVESHPIHLHGFNFHVVAQGFGNYEPARDGEKLNLLNPQLRNTVSVPLGGWAIVRFQANNPGVWFMHCHLEAHLPIGLATVLVVEDGPTPSTKLPPPPSDLPKC